MVVDPVGGDWPGLGHGFVICREEAMIGILPGFMRNNDQWPVFRDHLFPGPQQHVMSILRALESHSFASNPLLSGKALLTVVA